MSEYEPNKWTILKMIPKEGDVLYKILAGWSGGYLDSDSWKISSGVVKFEETKDYYLFHNYSGSLYKCRKTGEGMTGLSSQIYSSKLEGVEGIETISIEDYLKEPK